MVAMIQTLRGAISLSELGPAMMHEHVFSDYRPQFRTRNLAVAKQELDELSACGGRTTVDVGPWPGRDITLYQELSPQVELHIVLSTGFYLESRTPEEYRALDEAAYMDRFRRELTEGIDGPEGAEAPRPRAALIKVAGNKAELTDWELKVMRAAARVQRDTGVPICTHACEGARSQFLALTRAGADPERIYLSHVEAEFGWEGRNLQEELEYLAWIVRAGGSLYFNNFMFEFDTPHEDLMYLMHALCDRGYAHRILFGMDANFRFDDAGNVWWEAQKEHPETAVRDFAYTYTGAIPLMRRWGFTDAQFGIFLVENPARMFSATRI